VIVWLLQAGPTDRTALIRRAAGGCPGCSPDRFLTFLGRHLLHVFSWHILVYFLLAQVMPAEPSAPLGAAALVLAVASLYLAAFGHDWLQRREAARRAAWAGDSACA
jgi:hypothetical protein